MSLTVDEGTVLRAFERFGRVTKCERLVPGKDLWMVQYVDKKARSQTLQCLCRALHRIQLPCCRWCCAFCCSACRRTCFALKHEPLCLGPCFTTPCRRMSLYDLLHARAASAPHFIKTARSRLRCMQAADAALSLNRSNFDGCEIVVNLATHMGGVGTHPAIVQQVRPVMFLPCGVKQGQLHPAPVCFIAVIDWYPSYSRLSLSPCRPCVLA